MDIERWLNEPGTIRTIEFSYDCINRFWCRLEERDSQPEFYDKIEALGIGTGKTVEDAYVVALSKFSRKAGGAA